METSPKKEDNDKVDEQDKKKVKIDKIRKNLSIAFANIDKELEQDLSNIFGSVR